MFLQNTSEKLLLSLRQMDWTEFCRIFILAMIYVFLFHLFVCVFFQSKVSFGFLKNCPGHIIPQCQALRSSAR